jgi:ubiquinone/menaquinone biosynthesis C-methylase UbiE
MTTIPMQISSSGNDVLRNEQELIDALPLDGARVLELGCGTADKTRTIAKTGRVASIVALEVDERQHAKNLLIDDLPNVHFALGGAEAIPAADASIDIIFLFKSLHHVPNDLLDTAFAEMHRVLAPGGLVYISEPVFGGEYNDILRLFHDEQRVRAAAFAATERAVASQRMTLVSETFFKSLVKYRDFAKFEDKVLNVTHTEHRLSPALHEQVREKFNAHVTEDGARFEAPFRVDLLRKAA